MNIKLITNLLSKSGCKTSVTAAGLVLFIKTNLHFGLGDLYCEKLQASPTGYLHASFSLQICLLCEGSLGKMMLCRYVFFFYLNCVQNPLMIFAGAIDLSTGHLLRPPQSGQHMPQLMLTGLAKSHTGMDVVHLSWCSSIDSLKKCQFCAKTDPTTTRQLKAPLPNWFL